MIIVTILILIVTGLVTFLGFRDQRIFERYCFRPDGILVHKEWFRLISSGFLHVDWVHFGMNAISFCAFSQSIELRYGGMVLLAIYFGSIVGGSLLALLFHRNHEYTAVGASGGVCGIIFASLFLLPGTRIMMFPLPIGIPAWLYAIGFLLASYFGIRKRVDSIGHDAHFGGAIVGVLLSLALYPRVVLPQWPMLALVLGLSGVLLWYLVRNPLVSAGRIFNFDRTGNRPSARHQGYGQKRVVTEVKDDVDRILDKISKEGFTSLSPGERSKLEAYSKTKKA